MVVTTTGMQGGTATFWEGGLGEGARCGRLPSGALRRAGANTNLPLGDAVHHDVETRFKALPLCMTQDHPKGGPRARCRIGQRPTVCPSTRVVCVLDLRPRTTSCGMPTRRRLERIAPARQVSSSRGGWVRASLRRNRQACVAGIATNPILRFVVFVQTSSNKAAALRGGRGEHMLAKCSRGHFWSLGPGRQIRPNSANFRPSLALIGQTLVKRWPIVGHTRPNLVSQDNYPTIVVQVLEENSGACRVRGA